MSIPAQKAYQLMPGEEKTPTLAVECLLHKDKKGSHLVLFMPGGTLATEAPGDTSLRLVLTFDGTRHVTPWTQYVDPGTFTFATNSEADRVQFMQGLLQHDQITIEFKPFLTGVTTKSVFALAPLREEVAKHPECAP